MDLAAFRALLEPEGQAALREATALRPQEADFLGHFSRLSRRYPPELARAALETAILRQEAEAKFPQAAQMYFTRAALEQATGQVISAYRAERYRGAALAVDLGCSIGGDTLALAALAPTLGIDLDPLRLAMAQANLQAVTDGRESPGFVQADLTASLPLRLPSQAALFFDPARRAEGRRIYSVRDYHPPLDTLRDWLPRCPALGVKISPGVNLEEISVFEAGPRGPGSGSPEVEFISVKGELKEAVLWFGPLKTAKRRATVLPGPFSMHSPVDLLAEPDENRRLSEPQGYLYEPDPAVLRAGLVTALGEQLDAAQLDPDIAYLTADRPVETPFARYWAVEDWFPFQLKRLRAWLRERGVGRVVVKKRGSPLQPEALIRDLRLSGPEERVLFLTHLEGRPVVVVCFPTP